MWFCVFLTNEFRIAYCRYMEHTQKIVKLWCTLCNCDVMICDIIITSVYVFVHQIQSLFLSVILNTLTVNKCQIELRAR